MGLMDSKKWKFPTDSDGVGVKVLIFYFFLFIFLILHNVSLFVDVLIVQ